MGKDFEASLSDLERGAGAGAGAAADAAPVAEAGPEAAHPTVPALRARFGDAVLHHEVHAGDEHVVYVPGERVPEILKWLKTEETEAYDLLLDVTGVDFGGGRPLQIVYQLCSLAHRRLLRVKAELPLDALEIESVVPLWSTANWLEREVYDMFGVHFRGHPDLRRILMPENYAEGHPLRKDFPLRGRFSRAEQTRRALELELEDYYSPEELAVVRRRRPREGAAGEEPHGAADVVVTPADAVDNPAAALGQPEDVAPEPAPREEDAEGAGPRGAGA